MWGLIEHHILQCQRRIDWHHSKHVVEWYYFDGL